MTQIILKNNLPMSPRDVVRRTDYQVKKDTGLRLGQLQLFRKVDPIPDTDPVALPRHLTVVRVQKAEECVQQVADDGSQLRGG